jgi:O-antigen ligase
MKNILLDTKYNYILLLCLAAFPVLPKGIQSILVIVAVVWALAGNIAAKTGPVMPKAALKPLLALGALFFLYLVSLAYTKDLKTGFGFITRCLPLFVLPLIFLLRPGILNPKRLYHIKLVYCLAIIGLLLKITYIAYSTVLVDKNSYWEFRKNIEGKTKVHGTYLCMWFGLAIMLLVAELKKVRSYSKPWLAVAVVLLMMACTGYWMYAVGGRMPLVATLIAVFILIINSLKQFIIASLIVVLGIGVVITVNPENGLVKKVTELKNYDFSFPEGRYDLIGYSISSEQIRNGIYYCAYNKIKESWLAGYGIGDVDNELQNCYDTTFTNTNTYTVLKYNSHSQYLQLLLSTGITGFVLFFLSYGFLLKKALKSKQTIYFAFLIFMLINFLFENILSRHDGILFFGFFNSVFFFQDKLFLNNEKSLS